MVNDSGKWFTFYSGTLFPSFFCYETRWRIIHIPNLANQSIWRPRLFLLGNALTKLSFGPVQRIVFPGLAWTSLSGHCHGVRPYQLIEAPRFDEVMNKKVIHFQEFFGIKSFYFRMSGSSESKMSSEVKKTGNLSCHWDSRFFSIAEAATNFTSWWESHNILSKLQ